MTSLTGVFERCMLTRYRESVARYTLFLKICTRRLAFSVSIRPRPPTPMESRVDQAHEH
jgi:hypothetical protein